MMNDKLNKTAICSVLALEIIDFAKKTQDEQIKIKSLFNSFINQAVIDIPEADRIIVDTINGAAITCNGPLEDALEDALFISITIRDEILKNNAQSFNPLYVQFGINLGPARVTNNAGSQTNITGDGIDVAQRIMSFANPNQILVSQVYFEMASKLTQEMAQMFEKYDMHAYEHDVYAVRLLKGGAEAEDAAISADTIAPVQAIASNINWLYVGTGLLTLAAFFALIKLVSAPTEPTITIVNPINVLPANVQPAQIQPTAIKPAVEQLPAIEAPATTETDATPDAEPVVAGKPATANAVDNEPKKANASQKQASRIVIVKPKVESKTESKPAENKVEKPAANVNDNKAPANTAAKPADAKADKNASNEKSGWKTFTDSVKSGTERKCTQAEIALNQCNN
jgi:class 3 adenylate cyclase